MKTKIARGNTKLGKVANISLPPVKACGNCTACAKDCYALKAYRMYKGTRAAWDSNFDMATHDRETYFADIMEYVQKKAPKFFRWHVSGDILDQDYLESMADLAESFPGTRFLAFTKMHHLDYSRTPHNLQIIFSMFPSMPYHGAVDIPTAWMQDGTETRIPADALECPGNCETCGMCFNLDKIGRDVVFTKH